jgi:hypothetical protein
MARVSFTVDYTQDAGSSNGEITLTSDSTSTTVSASGRLDNVGDRVVSPVIPGAVGGHDAAVECVLTSSHAMRVTVAIGNILDEYQPNVIERVLENVPVTKTP